MITLSTTRPKAGSCLTAGQTGADVSQEVQFLPWTTASARRLLRSLENGCKRSLRAISPRAYARLREARNPWARLTGRIGRRQDWRVASGPFAGMRYIDNAHGSRLAPKLVGSYEAELHGVIQRVIESAPPTVIDVGCAEGYYAVGLARALPSASVVAFDISEPARALCGELARANGVADRVAIEGFCDCQTLHRLPLTGAFLLVDCEGFELELLRPDLVPGLAHTTILVELHDCFVPGLSERLLARFRDTHRVRLFPQQGRDPKDYPMLHWLNEPDQIRALDEDRRINGEPIEQHWALLEPLHAPSLCGDSLPNNRSYEAPTKSALHAPCSALKESPPASVAPNSRTDAPHWIAP